MSLVSSQVKKTEQRAYRRVEHSEPVRYEFKDPDHFGGCVSYDISEGGIKLRLHEFVALGTELVLNIHLTPDRMVECMGKVVWVRQLPYVDQYQVGIEFEDIDSIIDSRSRIHQYIRRI